MSIQGLSPFFNQVMGFVSIFIRHVVFLFVVSSIRYWLLLVKASKMAIINKKKHVLVKMWRNLNASTLLWECQTVPLAWPSHPGCVFKRIKIRMSYRYKHRLARCSSTTHRSWDVGVTSMSFHRGMDKENVV